MPLNPVLSRAELGIRTTAQMTKATSTLAIEAGTVKDFGPCECCGDNSRKVTGFVYRGDVAEAAYFVEWTLGQVGRHGAHFDLILGRWGEGATSSDRHAVSVEFRRTDKGLGFMVIDATDREVSRNELVERGLRRDEVVGTALATEAFDIIDTIWLKDERIAEIRGPG